MSHPKKTKGYRKIVVDDLIFRWRFDTDSPDCAITLQDGTQSGQQAFILFKNVPDSWLSFPNGRPAAFRVTPRMIPPLIRRAIKGGWNPNRAASQFIMELCAEDLEQSHSVLAEQPGE